MRLKTIAALVACFPLSQRVICNAIKHVQLLNLILEENQCLQLRLCGKKLNYNNCLSGKASVQCSGPVVKIVKVQKYTVVSYQNESFSSE